ncbi:MAG TPA: metal ABC transporter permease [Gemmataceae bacterium]|nr:metal ABC transporter permease [Gemmataceae bacterium]
MFSASLSSFLIDFAPSDWLDRAISYLASLAPEHSFFAWSFNLKVVLALILVSLCCGAIGSLVIGGRMAFFSDALAHCSFAGVSIGFLLFLVFGPLLGYEAKNESAFWTWLTIIMVFFGILAGCGIVWVRTRTGLSSDTVIGVFFAGAVGLAAALRDLMRHRALFNLEDFLFGDPMKVTSGQLLILAGLLVFTALLLAGIYNHLMLASFNQSLALSRRVPVQLVHYLFIVLLALIVNLCLRFVGALLINALLIIPAATAVNLSQNMRQLFWRTIFLSLVLSLAGQWLSWDLQWSSNSQYTLGVSGTIVLLNVFAFILSMVVGPWLRARQAGS